MKLYNRRTKRLVYLWLGICVVALAGWSLRGPLGKTLSQMGALWGKGDFAAVCHYFGTWCYCLVGISIATLVVWWCFRHKLHRGVVYAVKHAWYCGQITRALVQAGAGYGIDEQNHYITPPRVMLTFDQGMAHGSIKIRSHIKYDKALERVDLSSAIGRYRIVQTYATDDHNFWVYDFEDSYIDQRLVFNNFEDFAAYAKKCGNYKIMTNARYTLPLASMLITGTTGSGKTYAAYSIIMQMLLWTVEPTLYFADPKNSSLYVMGRHISPERSAGSVEGIISLLEVFYNNMQQRKVELQPKLEMRLDSTYQDWDMGSHVFFLDETSAFVAAINGLDKATRDKVWKMLRSITLEGRQLGFALVLLTQKADSNDIPTQIRDNLIFKCCLGNVPQTTLITTFEKAADLPQRKFAAGEGLFSYQGITREPQFISFPTLRFDILQAVKYELLPDCKI